MLNHSSKHSNYQKFHRALSYVTIRTSGSYNTAAQGYFAGLWLYQIYEIQHNAFQIHESNYHKTVKMKLNVHAVHTLNDKKGPFLTKSNKDYCTDILYGKIIMKCQLHLWD